MGLMDHFSVTIQGQLGPVARGGSYSLPHMSSPGAAALGSSAQGKADANEKEG